ncbi:MAG: hypothetical protein ACI4J0_00600 [Huintestinicola sp.]|uniref:hypothetical protein n=1 Tax=Huintestinicola sp. TaxID=2981661 RepID=UPI003F033C3F
MASNNEIAGKAAASLGLSFDKKRGVGYGQYGGFTMLIKPCEPNSAKNIISLYFYAQKDGMAADRDIVAGAGLPDGVTYDVIDFFHTFDVKVTFKSSDVIQKLVQTAEISAAALSSAGYVNCSGRGEEGQTDIYSHKGSYLFLTPANAAETASGLNSAKTEYDEIVENRLMGVIGGLVGSLAGVLVILLIGRLGRVSMLGGLVMGFVSILGYKKLGHKLSAAGAVICTVIAVIMSYLAFRVDTAIDLWDMFKDVEDAADFPFSFYLLNSKLLFEIGESLSTYYTNMFLIMLSGAGGAAAAIWADHLETKNSFKLEKLGE